MKIETFKNTYGYERARCPFCTYEASTRGKEKLMSLKRHITNAAKMEAFEWELADVESKVMRAHLDYVKEHTSMQPVKAAPVKRQFDNDLTI